MTTHKASLLRMLVVTAAALLVTACLYGFDRASDAIESPPAQVALDMQRGQLLYDAQCVSCHTTEMHWRDKSIVSSWSDVLAQVSRWQDNIGQQWSPSDIGDVSAYLNATYYKVPCSLPGCQGPSTAGLVQEMSLLECR